MDDNEALYHKRIENPDIVKGEVAPPPSAGRLLSVLTKYAARQKS
jgi:lipid-binding SYLF domain-containing protein